MLYGDEQYSVEYYPYLVWMWEIFCRILSIPHNIVYESEERYVWSCAHELWKIVDITCPRMYILIKVEMLGFFVIGLGLYLAYVTFSYRAWLHGDRLCDDYYYSMVCQVGKEDVASNRWLDIVLPPIMCGIGSCEDGHRVCWESS